MFYIFEAGIYEGDSRLRVSPNNLGNVELSPLGEIPRVARSAPPSVYCLFAYSRRHPMCAARALRSAVHDIVTAMVVILVGYMRCPEQERTQPTSPCHSGIYVCTYGAKRFWKNSAATYEKSWRVKVNSLRGQ